VIDSVKDGVSNPRLHVERLMFMPIIVTLISETGTGKDVLARTIH